MLLTTSSRVYVFTLHSTKHHIVSHVITSYYTHSISSFTATTSYLRRHITIFFFLILNNNYTVVKIIIIITIDLPRWQAIWPHKTSMTPVTREKKNDDIIFTWIFNSFGNDTILYGRWLLFFKLIKNTEDPGPKETRRDVLHTW